MEREGDSAGDLEESSLTFQEDQGVFTLSALPPMPSPELAEMRGQASTGTCVVLMIVGMCVTGTRWGASALRQYGKVTSVMPLVCVLVVYIEAAVALVCLVGLLFCDPGTIKRSREACFPMPTSVAEKLRSGVLAEEVSSRRHRDNIVEGGRTYCVRCLVWRDPGQEPKCSEVGKCPGQFCEGGGFHHCSTCQRCVADFDHHCAVFGRCIAGRGFSGNMGYFKLLVCAGYCGGPTCGLTLIGAFGCASGNCWVLYVVIGYFVCLLCMGSSFMLASSCGGCWEQRVRRKYSELTTAAGVPQAASALGGEAEMVGKAL